MYCKKCGDELGENAKFCKNCGTEVTRRAVSVAEGGTTQVTQSQGEVAPQPALVKMKAEPTAKIKKPKKKKTGLKIIFIVLIVFVFFALLFGAGLWTYQYVRQLTAVETDVEATDEQAELERLERVEARKKEKEEALLAEIEGETLVEAETIQEEIAEEPASESAVEEVIAVSQNEVETEDTAIHRYQIVMVDCFWSEAYEEALESGGYLVRINTPEEMDVIVEQIEAEGRGDGIFWLGGARMADSSSYNWIDENGNSIGDELNEQEFWLPGEPSMWDSTLETEEYYMNMFYMESQGRFIWNDTVNNLPEVAPTYEGKIGYIIEFEEEQ